MILRPFVNEAIKILSEYYEIILYSLGEENYVNTIVDIIDPGCQYVSFALNRNHNVIDLDEGKHLKNLKIFTCNRELKDIIIVDN